MIRVAAVLAVLPGIIGVNSDARKLPKGINAQQAEHAGGGEVVKQESMINLVDAARALYYANNKQPNSPARKLEAFASGFFTETSYTQESRCVDPYYQLGIDAVFLNY
jgi:hypothetical protein